MRKKCVQPSEYKILFQNFRLIRLIIKNAMDVHTYRQYVFKAITVYMYLVSLYNVCLSVRIPPKASPISKIIGAIIPCTNTVKALKFQGNWITVMIVNFLIKFNYNAFYMTKVFYSQYRSIEVFDSIMFVTCENI